MNLQDALRRFDAVSESEEKCGRELTEEPPGQSNEIIETPVAGSVYYRLKLLRKLQDGHLGSARQDTR